MIKSLVTFNNPMQNFQHLTFCDRKMTPTWIPLFTFYSLILDFYLLLFHRFTYSTASRICWHICTESCLHCVWPLCTIHLLIYESPILKGPLQPSSMWSDFSLITGLNLPARILDYMYMNMFMFNGSLIALVIQSFLILIMDISLN